MILYFTGTGNSRHTARKAAEKLSDTLTDITPLLQAGKKSTFSSERPYLFVLPTYSSYIPRIIEKFIIESDFSGDDRVYFLLTCGASCSRPGVAKKLTALCQKKNLRFMGVEQVVMPENYITLFFAPSEETAEKIIEKADLALLPVLEKIEKGEPLFTKKHFTFSTYIVNPLFYKLLVKDKPFFTTNACISCGKCVKVCPLGNIELKEGKPQWKGNCTQCMACISQCPVTAIEYGRRAKGKRRYYLP